MITELIELARQHNQRAGQLLSNAIADYLQTQNRTCDDHDIGNSLFYLGDEDLEKVAVL